MTVLKYVTFIKVMIFMNCFLLNITSAEKSRIILFETSSSHKCLHFNI